jgi:hypothetical protein
MLKIDDVNFVALAKDIRAHFWGPIAGLMTEVNTRFEHLTHGDV